MTSKNNRATTKKVKKGSEDTGAKREKDQKEPGQMGKGKKGREKERRKK